MMAAACATDARTEPAPPPSRIIGPPARLQYETVRSMLEDSKGNLWFGSWNQGVCRYDGTDLRYFTTADGLADNQVRSIREDHNGVVWFECASGLSGFDGSRMIAAMAKDYDHKDAWRLASRDLWFKEDGAVGATTREGQPGAYRYDGTTFTFHAYPVPFDPSLWGGYATTCIASGARGRMWFATYNAVFGFDGASLTTFDEARLGLDARTGRLHVRAVHEDRQGRLWIGNNGIGVLLVDGDRVIHFTQQHGLGKVGMHGSRTVPLAGDVTDGSPTMHRVFSIGEDRDGGIWFGTVESGAWRYDGSSLKNFTVADGLATSDVMGIYTDRRGDLWLLGTGVFRFDGARFERAF